MTGRTWHNIEDKTANKIKDYLLKQGGSEEEVKNPYETFYEFKRCSERGEMQK